jgi:hypothetical protein
MTKRECVSPRDVRAHFRIQVSTRPALACQNLSFAQTPSFRDGVFCVKGGTYDAA